MSTKTLGLKRRSIELPEFQAHNFLTPFAKLGARTKMLVCKQAVRGFSMAGRRLLCSAVVVKTEALQTAYPVTIISLFSSLTPASHVRPLPLEQSVLYLSPMLRLVLLRCQLSKCTAQSPNATEVRRKSRLELNSAAAATPNIYRNAEKRKSIKFCFMQVADQWDILSSSFS